ncbi:MAG: PQQ-binding-like beta-propeller repeat protein [Pseudomonadales bacterium]|nr:PQQ-binding-like beta-propeller repeat protein [Pseudomonadales bacterium]
MMKVQRRNFRIQTLILNLVALVMLMTTAATHAQRLPGTENGEWRYLGGDAGHTRYSPLDQINAGNFGELEEVWAWRSDNFGPNLDYFSRATPIYVDGMLYSVATPRRQVIAMDPATGENLWTFRETPTIRHSRSPRQAYGKGVAYAEVNGRGVIYITTPGFFLWALDAKTGLPLENWGSAVPLEGFGDSGVVDLIPHLVEDWGPWQDYVIAGGSYDPNYGIPRELGMVTASAPPIVVNGVVVVLVGHQPSYGQTRIENVPGDIMGFSAETGEFMWKFHSIPRPGEVGNETWENDAWRFSGDISTWAPASADPELGLVYMVTNASTVQSYAGHRPGHNLFGGSLLALDVQTGERRWHFQIHHSDQWNYDLPTPPMLMDLTVNGQRIPAVIQNTKQGLVFAFNRETGDPIWPIEERPVFQTQVPGNYTAATQPFPTLPEPVDGIVTNGLTEEYIIDYSPGLKEQAMVILNSYNVGGLYVPALPFNHENDYANNVGCIGGGNVISHPPVADPDTGMMYVSHHRNCFAPGYMSPTNGRDRDNPNYATPGEGGVTPNSTPTTGVTVVDWLPGGGGGGLPTIDGLRVFKPMDNELTGYNMHTGRHAWSVPVGPTLERITSHPLLQGVDIPDSGGVGFSIQIVMGDILVQTRAYSEGGIQNIPDAPLTLNARDKNTGEILASVPLSAPGQYGMMTYMHNDRQYIVVQTGSSRTDQPGGLSAFRLP